MQVFLVITVERKDVELFRVIRYQGIGVLTKIRIIF